MRDMIHAMMDEDPERRPTIEEVIKSLAALANEPMSETDLRSTFVPKDPRLTWTMRLFHTLRYNCQRRSSTVVP
jgi:hypothetical protein